MSENLDPSINIESQSEVGDVAQVSGGGDLSSLAAYIHGLGEEGEPDFGNMPAEAFLEPAELAAHNDWERYTASSELLISEGMNARSNFKNNKLPLPAFVAKVTQHRIAGTKDGRAFAASIRDDRPAATGKNLTDANVGAISVLAYDIDGTQQPWEATRVLKSEGIAHVVYSSWSHSAELAKFRVVVFLKKPFLVGDDDDRRLHTATYNALGERWGMKHDRRCGNVSRLFYYPAHDGKVVPFASFVPGRPMDYAAAIEHVRASDEKKKKEESPKQKPALKTRNLLRFNTTCRGLFEAERLVEAKDPEGIRLTRPTNGGIHCRCPNEDGAVTGRPHTDQDPKSTAFRVVNASGNTHGEGYTINCLTEGCTKHFGGDTLLFLDAMCVRYEIEDAENLILFCSDPEEARRRWGAWDTFSVNTRGNPSANQHNARIALRRLNVELSYNEFADTVLIKGLPKQGGTLTDAGVAHLRLRFERDFGFLLPKDYAYDLFGVIARETSFHPVKEYLDRVEKGWDGKPRLDTWLQKYAGVDDSPLYRSVGALWMIAGARRIRQPGCKFDEILTFEAGQGIEKSTMLETLAVRSEWFTDDVPMNASSKVMIEQTAGKWIIEFAEMAGASKAETEHMKASASRKVDRSRLVWRRFAEDFPRSFIGAATVNHERYLRDTTGNRRHWPAPVREIDLAALRRDLDQLWGEAATRERKGESIRLDKSLWDDAAVIQEARRVENPFLDRLAAVLEDHTGRLSSENTFMLAGLANTDRRPQISMDLVVEAMKKLGWEKKPSLRFGRAVLNGYLKGTPAQQRIVLNIWLDGMTRRYAVQDPDFSDRLRRDAETDDDDV